MSFQKAATSPQINLAARYNPVGIRAVIAATLQMKVRQIPEK